MKNFADNIIENPGLHVGKEGLYKVALPTKNIKVINSFYKGMHDMQRCLRL